MRVCSDVADAHASFAKAWFHAANIMALGYLSPVSQIVERTCDFSSGVIHDVEDAWMGMSQQSSMDMESMKGEIIRLETERQQPPMSMMEREMMMRTQPDYSNLRRAANGEDLRLRSILDDDALWAPGQTAMSKSAHRYDAGMTRERRLLEQTDLA
jgi:hypothetical protein